MSPSLLGLAADSNSPSSPIRVACVGDSITAGIGADKGKDYPTQVAALLGEGWTVKNFGNNGATLLRKGDNPYANHLSKPIAFEPDIVVIMLGTNDTKPKNWIHKNEFAADYRWMIGQFQKLPKQPRIFICRPCPVSGTPPEINEAGIIEQIPIIDRLAVEMNVGLIDMHAALAGDPARYLPDNIHPSTEGASLLAAAAAKALRERMQETPAPSATSPTMKSL